MHRWRGLTLLVVLAGCASPAARFEQAAHELGLQPERIAGAGFEHALFVNPAAQPGAATLHVYLDGDGTPLVAGLPADDPTPRDPLMLRLIAADPAPALYLGRPCYHRLRPEPACRPTLWTDARYGETVVASMAAALRTWLQRWPYNRLWWIGYSGGGALALLLAERFPQSEAVVTIAGNLDLAAFARRYGKDVVAASLNPGRVVLPPGMLQYHYIGADDRVLPASARFARITIANFDHRCCWQQIWPRLLAEVAATVPTKR